MKLLVAILFICVSCTPLHLQDPVHIDDELQEKENYYVVEKDANIKPKTTEYEKPSHDRNIYELEDQTALEFDKYYGKFVRIHGYVINIDGKHAHILTNSGSNIDIAHIDKEIDMDWFNYLGKKVEVVGKLVSQSDFLISGKINGPFVTNIRTFRALE